MQDKSEHLQLIEQRLAKLVRDKLIDVPMLPDIARKALILSQDPESDAAEMAKLIQSDQTMAAHVMRVANSAAYSGRANMVSLQQAIARLGIGVISEIALSTSLATKLFNTPGFESQIASQWHHALVTGLWAKEIARSIRSNVEVAFLSGLLHEIGYSTVLQSILDIAKLNNISLSESEVLELTARNAHQVSVYIVSEWQLPQIIIETISSYQKYESANVQAAQVYAARQLADIEMTGQEMTVTSLDEAVLSQLNLYQEDVESLLSKRPEVTEKLQELAL